MAQVMWHATAREVGRRTGVGVGTDGGVARRGVDDALIGHERRRDLAGREAEELRREQHEQHYGHGCALGEVAGL